MVISFFVETQGVEYAERQAVIFKLDKIDDCQAVFDLLQVLLEAQDALSVQIGNAVVAENFACAVVFAVDVEIQRQPQPACFIEKKRRFDVLFVLHNLLKNKDLPPSPLFQSGNRNRNWWLL